MNKSKIVDMIPIVNEDGDLIADDNNAVTFTSVDLKPAVTLHYDVDSLDLTADYIMHTGEEGQFFRLHMSPNPSLNTAPPGSPSTSFEDEERRFIWSEAPSKLFFDLYIEHRDRVGKSLRTQEHLFSLIAKEMQKKGYSISAVQVRSRYRTLERQMRNYIQRSIRKHRIGRGAKELKNKELIFEMFGHKNSLTPECTVVSHSHGFQGKTEMQNAGLANQNFCDTDETDEKLATEKLNVLSKSKEEVTPSKSTKVQNGKILLNITDTQVQSSKQKNGTVDVKAEDTGKHSDENCNFGESVDISAPPDKCNRNATNSARRIGNTCYQYIRTPLRKRPFSECSSVERAFDKLHKITNENKNAEHEENEFDLFCKSIAVQLKNMPLDRALLCQEKLQKVLTEERLSQCRIKSVPSPSTSFSTVNSPVDSMD